jgi:hypothetical protein
MARPGRFRKALRPERLRIRKAWVGQKGLGRSDRLGKAGKA